MHTRLQSEGSCRLSSVGSFSDKSVELLTDGAASHCVENPRGKPEGLTSTYDEKILAQNANTDYRTGSVTQKPFPRYTEEISV